MQGYCKGGQNSKRVLSVRGRRNMFPNIPSQIWYLIMKRNKRKFPLRGRLISVYLGVMYMVILILHMR